MTPSPGDKFLFIVDKVADGEVYYRRFRVDGIVKSLDGALRYEGAFRSPLEVWSDESQVASERGTGT